MKCSNAALPGPGVMTADTTTLWPIRAKAGVGAPRATQAHGGGRPLDFPEAGIRGGNVPGSGVSY